MPEPRVNLSPVQRSTRGLLRLALVLGEGNDLICWISPAVFTLLRTNAQIQVRRCSHQMPQVQVPV